MSTGVVEWELCANVSVCDFDWVPTGEKKPGLGQLVARVVEEDEGSGGERASV